jgi:hypothetical protein
MQTKKIRVNDSQWHEDARREEQETLKRVFGDHVPITGLDSEAKALDPNAEWTDEELAALTEGFTEDDETKR